MTEPPSTASDPSGLFSPIAPAARPAFTWAKAPPIEKIVQALCAAAPDRAPRDVVRFVGGCVRDSLIGVEPKDIDAATSLTPDQSSAAMTKAGMAVHPTGLEHGTVTAVCEGQVVEVTTLRTDVATDGRRATVAFTDDWALDAARRDFTMNALYLTPDGAIYDPVGGRADLEARHVRFIGSPAARIEEDYLRILRFFRFSARFAAGDFDAEGLSACEQLRGGMAQLSAERIGAETGLILSLPAPDAALTAMARTGVLHEIYPFDADLQAASVLKRLAPDAAAPVMLAALWGEKGEGLAKVLRLSRVDEGRRRAALAAAAALAPGFDDRAVREHAYKAGEIAFADGLLLAQAVGRLNGAEAKRLHEIIVASPPPLAFPLSGKHVLAAGGAPGPRIGAVLRAVEEQWIAENFPDEARLAVLLAEAIKVDRQSNR